MFKESLKLFILSKEFAEKVKIPEFPLYRYEEQWNQAIYKVDSANIDLKKIDELFEASYKAISGK